jgi:hypothetical protein
VVLTPAIGGLSSAKAQEVSDADRDTARARFSLGVEAAQGGDWESARQMFDEAFALYPNPVILVNLASAQVQTGHLVEGAESYRTFLSMAETDERATPHIPTAREALASVVPRIPKVRLTLEDLGGDDVVLIDDRPISRPRLAAPIAVNPGDHRVTVQHDATVRGEASFSVPEGDVIEVTVPLTPASTTTAAEDYLVLEPTPPATRSSSRDQKWLYIGGAVGTAAVLAHVVTAIVVARGGGTKPVYSGGNWGVLEID